MTTKTISISKRAAKALDGSICKWATISAVFDRHGNAHAWRHYTEGASSDCPLCQLYNRYQLSAGNLSGCSKTCPIKRDTGCDYCENTPYEDWNDGEENAENAKAMLDYLTGLKAKCVIRE